MQCFVPARHQQPMLGVPVQKLSVAGELAGAQSAGHVQGIAGGGKEIFDRLIKFLRISRDLDDEAAIRLMPPPNKRLPDSLMGSKNSDLFGSEL